MVISCCELLIYFQLKKSIDLNCENRLRFSNSGGSTVVWMVLCFLCMEWFWWLKELCWWEVPGYPGRIVQSSLGLKTMDYTWCNMQEGKNRVYLRLDRGLANTEWIDYFKETRVHHIVDSTYDHYLVTNSFTPQLPRKRCFHLKWCGPRGRIVEILLRLHRGMS